MLKFINNFLKDRQMKIQVNNTSSDYYTVNSGIPQGSILSPTLFNTMTFISIYHQMLRSFSVDDTTIWSTNEDLVTATNNVQTVTFSPVTTSIKYLFSATETTKCLEYI